MLRHEDNTNSQEFIDPNDEDNSDGAAKLLGLINQIRKSSEDDDISDGDVMVAAPSRQGNSNSEDNWNGATASEEDSEDKAEDGTPTDNDIEEEEEVESYLYSQRMLRRGCVIATCGGGGKEGSNADEPEVSGYGCGQAFGLSEEDCGEGKYCPVWTEGGR